MPKPLSKKLSESEVVADPKLERRTRRTHSPEYKLKIIAAADACQHGELGALLRQENLYSGQLKQWREEFADGGVGKLSKSAPGPKSRLTAEQRENEKLRKENAKLKRELEITIGCVELQKKALAMLDLQNSGSDQ